MTVERKTADDYYTQQVDSIEPPGVWYAGPRPDGTRNVHAIGIIDGQTFGRASDISDDVDRFATLVQGFNPETGEKLVQNAGERGRVALHDFCVSAPKSISVIWAMAGGELKSGIENAQKAGAREHLDFMSLKSFSRQGKGGLIKTPAPLMGAMFEHASSREGDPQLHIHCVMLNVCQRPDGTTGALQTMEMMRWQGAAASLAHARMAWELRKLGLPIEKKGKLFEVAGVSPDVLKHFSKRREQIEKAVNKRLLESGLDQLEYKKHGKLHDKVAIDTRSNKPTMTREELQKVWDLEGAKLGFTQADVEALRNDEPLVEMSREELLEAARNTVSELTEHKAVFKEADLLAALAVSLVGLASPEQIKQAAEDVKMLDLLTTKTVNRAGLGEDIFTTREMLLLEQTMLKLSSRNDGAHVLCKEDELELPAQLTQNQRDVAVRATTDTNAVSVIEHEELDPRKIKHAKPLLGAAQLPGALLEEQRKAAVNALADGNAVSVIEGTAGAGKTFTMASLSREFERHGYEVTGLASGWVAAKNLQKSAKLSSGRAIAGWANDIAKGKIRLHDKSLIVLDEAGMVGTRDMVSVLQIAKDAGAKVILLGDTLQQGSVSAGAALRVISKEIGSSRLNQIFRQKDPKQREAVHDFFAGKAAKGLESYATHGNVHFAEGAEATDKLVIEKWMQSRTAHADKSHLMMASDNVSVNNLNEIAHAARKAAGEIGDGVMLKTMDCKEAGDLVEMSVGDQVVFRKNSQKDEVFNRTRGVIEKIEDGTISIRLEEDNSLMEVNIRDPKWQHEEGGLAIQLGYAISTYSSQGLTADRTILKDSTVLDRASAGVGMSRHREDCQVVVDKQVRYEAKMSQVLDDQWAHISNFSNEECLARMSKSWSSEREKTSTLDFDRWEKAGAQVDVKAELAMKELRDAHEIANREIDRIRENAAADVEQAGKVFPFQTVPDYILPAPKPSAKVVQDGTDALTLRDVESAIAFIAKEQNFLSFQDDQTPVFVGYRPDADGVKPVCLYGGDEPRTEAFRNRFPPVLKGDDASKDVAIVSTGMDALHLQSIQWLERMPRSTVIVSGDRDDSLSMPHIREIVQKAEKVERHDKTPAAQAPRTKESTVAAGEVVVQVRGGKMASGVASALKGRVESDKKAAEVVAERQSLAQQACRAAEAAQRRQAQLDAQKKGSVIGL
jgi:conjugative relaxase-like TrwC/TraI family protein